MHIVVSYISVHAWHSFTYALHVISWEFQIQQPAGWATIHSQPEKDCIIT